MLLSIQGLSSTYRTSAGDLRAVDALDLEIGAGESVGLIGESGCGKTTVVKSVLGLLEPNGRIDAGTIRFQGEDLLTLREGRFRRLLWDQISFIPQDAMDALNPVYKVSTQIMEAVKCHRSFSERRGGVYRKRAAALFERVGLDASCLGVFPHQLSGGMAQRAIIAMALILNPALVIADEPTTALDVVNQRKILNIFKWFQQEKRLSLVLVTHDIGVVSESCDTVCVLFAGRVIEKGPVRDVLRQPLHPYTLYLVRTLNAFQGRGKIHRQPMPIPEDRTLNTTRPRGCCFQDRCPYRSRICARETPVPAQHGPAGHLVACHRVEDIRRSTNPARGNTR